MKKNSMFLDGMASYHEDKMFSFAPNDPVAGRVEKFHTRGTGHQLSDGSFEFVPEQRKRSQSTLIKKLPHGRVSITADGFVQLTLKISLDEVINISRALRNEALEAADVVEDPLPADTYSESTLSAFRLPPKGRVITVTSINY